MRIKADPNYLDHLNWFRRWSSFQPNYKIQKEKNTHFGQTACKICYHNNYSCIRLGIWKVQHLNQSHSKVDAQSKFLAGLGRKNGWTIPSWNRCSYLIQTRTFHEPNRPLPSSSWKTESTTPFFREQIELKKKLVTEDCINWGVSSDEPFSALNLIGGVDISFPKGDADHACACLIVLSFPDLKVQ